MECAEFVEPEELEELLGEEEAGDEEGLWGEEGEVLVVDLFHVGGAEYAVLLRGEVVDEGGWGEISSGAQAEAHGGWVDDDDGYGLVGCCCWCCYGWLVFRVSNMYGLLPLVRPSGRYLNDDSEMKLVMETRLFVIHRLTTRHSSDEVNPDKEKTPDDVLSWRNMEMSSSLPLHFPIEFTLTPSSSSACRPHSASPLYT